MTIFAKTTIPHIEEWNPLRNLIEVLRESLWITLAGFAIGLPLCIALSRLLHAQLYQLNPLDPVRFLVAVILTLFVVICAALLPAKCAASVNPMHAQRAE